MSSLSPQWRSLEQLADDSSFVARVAQEFPGLAEALSSQSHDRRQVLRLMAAALAMGGLGGCDVGAPGGTLIPAVRVPPNIIPGLPNFYSTANVLDGYATGVVVKHQMGRPIKVEGNPQHPASLGATDAFAQAQVLDFYDPDRSWGITAHGLPADRQNMLTALAAQRTRISTSHGAGFRILTGAITSPTLAAQLDSLLSALPEARWHQWQPISRDNVWKGAGLAYGQSVEVIPKLDTADVVLAIDSDLLSSAPGHLRFARDFASRRNPTRTKKMLRLYAVEPTPTLTGSAADHRFIAGRRELHQVVTALVAGVLQQSPPSAAPGWVGKVAADLTANPGRALVHLGPNQPPETHALIHAINAKLGAPGSTLDLVAPVVHSPIDQAASLNELVEDMRGGTVSTLLIIDSNPAYDAPGVLGFTEALKRVDFSMTLTAAPNETSNATVWGVPMAHAWETWSDGRAYDGTATIVQPQALPLYQGTSMHTLLALFTDPAPTPTLDLVQTTWKNSLAADFAQGWHDALANGVVPNTTSPKANVSLRPNAIQLPPPPPDYPLTVLFRPDPHLWDGRYANNAWLQELPRPLTKLTWDNPLMISPRQARNLELRNGDKARLTIGNMSSTAPVWIMPGQANDCVVALLGSGRRDIGAVGSESGFDFYPLTGRTEAPSLAKASGRVELASTDHHDLIFNDDGDIVRHGTLADYAKDPHFLASGEQEPHLYRWKPKGPAAWAMSVDLNACIGCNACVVACMAENNIPVVGKQQVIREREMHWLRIDRYYEGSPDAPDSYFQPMLCMHCEQAPCEVVCPVGATVHDNEGLNVMVYNRCVGTRFCSNNCPYKVRRFNYFAFAQEEQRPPASAQPRRDRARTRRDGEMHVLPATYRRGPHRRGSGEPPGRRR